MWKVEHASLNPPSKTTLFERESYDGVVEALVETSLPKGFNATDDCIIISYED